MVLAIFPLNEANELRRKIVAELSESIMQLSAIDRPRAVLVKVLEDTLPVLDILEDARELVESGLRTVG